MIKDRNRFRVYKFRVFTGSEYTDSAYYRFRVLQV